jgi:hypothetical protein
MLAYSDSTEGNCQTIEQAHKRCLEWAGRFGMKFAPQKYELIHFTTKRKKFNLAATIRLGNVTKEPTSSVRVLGVWFDPKLKWTSHVSKIKEKMASQIGALTRITTSVWGASFIRSRIVYSAVVRPAIAYAAPIWHSPTTTQRAKGPAAKLSSTQNKCLRIIAGAYKATPVRALETETFIPPLDLYLDGRVAAYQARIEGSKAESVIQEACKWIKRRKWCRRRGREGTGEQIEARPSQRARWAFQREEDLGTEKTGPQMVQEAWSRRWAS